MNIFMTGGDQKHINEMALKQGSHETSEEGARIILVKIVKHERTKVGGRKHF